MRDTNVEHKSSRYLRHIRTPVAFNVSSYKTQNGIAKLHPLSIIVSQNKIKYKNIKSIKNRK
jgi:hypothetical protein